MASQQLVHMNELYTSIKERISKPDIDLATRRDSAENLHWPPANPRRSLTLKWTPIMVYYGAHEMLAGEAVEFAKRAKDAGVDVSLHSLPKGQHNFILDAGGVPQVDQAIEEIGRWLRSKLGLGALAAE
jgi:acetyl esterase/lipase